MVILFPIDFVPCGFTIGFNEVPRRLPVILFPISFVLYGFVVGFDEVTHTPVLDIAVQDEKGC